MTKAMERKINRIKRAIRREIAIEVRAIKILAPIFGGALVTLCSAWAIISGMIIMLP